MTSLLNRLVFNARQFGRNSIETNINPAAAATNVHIAVQVNSDLFLIKKSRSGPGILHAKSNKSSRCVYPIHKIDTTPNTSKPSTTRNARMFFGSPDNSVFPRLASNRTSPAAINVKVLLKLSKRLKTTSGCLSSLDTDFMERFSFQAMVKGMQLLGCPAILGETLRPILASHIYGGAR